MKKRHFRKARYRRCQSSRRPADRYRGDRKLALQQLEDRDLLTADVAAGIATSPALGLDLLLQADVAKNKLQLIDLQNSSQVIQEKDLDSHEPLQIQGSAAGDRLRIEIQTPVRYLGGIHFDAGGGRDEVLLNSGGLAELVLASTQTSDESFSVQFGANQFTFTSLESLDQNGAIEAASLLGGNRADRWSLSQRNGQQLDIRGLGGFGTSILLQYPSVQLALNSRSGNDHISIFDTLLDRVDLTVEGGAGDDTIELTNIEATRSDVIIAGAAGNDAILIDRSVLSRSNVTMLGGNHADSLIVAQTSLNRSDLVIQSGSGHDNLTLDANELSRSELLVRGGADDDTLRTKRLQLDRSSVDVRGGRGDDNIAIDQVFGDGLRLDGGQGSDSLHGPLAGASWLVARPNRGTVDGHDFQNIEHLLGADDQPDQFVVGPMGHVDGVLDSGLRENDSLVVQDQGEGPRELIHSITGSQRGVFSSPDGDVYHEHLGFESVEFGVEADSHKIELTASANLTLTQDSDGNLVTTIQHAFDAATKLNNLDGSDGVVVAQPGAAIGQSVSSAGDVNADGIEDFIVGAPGLNSAYVFYGTASGFPQTLLPSSLDGNNGFVLTGVPGQNTGWSVGGGGDVNGDGIDDLIVGEPGPSDNFAAGVSYIIFGRETAFDASLDLTSLDGSNGFAVVGRADGDASGFLVAIVGDTNGDEIDGILIGAPGADPDPTRADAGQAYLVMGSEQGFAPSMSVASLNGVNGFALSGGNAGDQAGYSVAGASDLNSDGVNDIAIGAPGADDSGDGAGAAYVFFGAGDFASANGLAGLFYDTDAITSLADATAAIVGQSPDATFEAYQIDYPNSESVTTSDSSTLLPDFLGMNAENVDGGESATIAGSVFTFDGFLYVPQANTYSFEVGSAAGFSLAIDGQTTVEFDGTRPFATSTGNHTFAAAGFYPISLLYYSNDDPAGIELKSDLTGQLDFITREQLYPTPPTASFDLAALDGHSGFSILGAAAGDALGYSVGSASDVNGDGPSDVAVGAPGADGSGVDSGQAYVLFGKELTSFDDSFAASYLAADLDGTDGITLSGSIAGGRVGASVAAVGDINGDGLDDAALGAPGSSTISGATHVVFGSSKLPTTGRLDLDSLDGVIGFTASAGEAGDSLGVSITGADINGDGLSDLLIGSNGDTSTARGLFGRIAGGASTTVNYALPDTLFSIDGGDAHTRVTVGQDSAPVSDTLHPGVDENQINTDGAAIHISSTNITVNDGVVLSTRHIDANADPATAPSIGDSGDLVLTANGNLSDHKASITIESGAALYANADQGSGFEAGEVVIKASHQTKTAALPITSLLAEGKRTAHIVIDDGVQILGGEIDIAAVAGIIDVSPTMQANVGGLIELAALEELEKYAGLESLPLAVQISVVESTVEIGKTGGNAVTIQGSESVSIDAQANAEAKGNAIFWTFPPAASTRFGLAFGLWYADATAKVTLREGVNVESTEADVAISADSVTKAGGAARVSQNLNQGLDIKDTTIPSNPNNVALSIGIGVTKTTAKVDVQAGTHVIADSGNVAITANGGSPAKIYPETRSYKDGKYGVSFGFLESTDDVRALVNGTVRAGGDKVKEELTFDPFTAVDTVNDTIQLAPDHGYETGDEVTYSPQLGGVIDGLQRLGHYYVIIDDAQPGLIQLAASVDDALDGVPVDLLDNPTLATTTATLPFTVVSDDADWIDFGFAHGILAGEAIVYSAVDGKYVGGLVDGETYYAVLVDGDEDGQLLQLATDMAGTTLADLDTNMSFVPGDTGVSLIVDTIDEGPGTITFTEPHNLTSGDAITYHPALGFQLLDGFTEHRYAPDMVFYAIESPSESDPSQKDPYTIRLALTQQDAVTSNGYTNALRFNVDFSTMTGIDHTLTPVVGSGITISAAMDGERIVESKARIGGSESGEKIWTRPEFTLAATSFRQSLYSNLNNSALDDVENNNLPNGVNANTDQDSLDVSSAFIYQDLNRTVEAVVGSSAVLTSSTDISISSSAEELGNVIVEAGASQSEQQSIKRAIGAGISLAVYTTTVEAIVNSGASLDAEGDIDVEAENVRSFPAPVDSGKAFGEFLLDEFENNPTELLVELNKSLLHPFFTTGWTYARAAPADADTALGFAFQYATYHNVTRAIIADGALVNQNADYRTDDQSIAVDAATTMQIVNMAGVFEFGFNLTGLVSNLAAASTSFKRKSSPLVEIGVEGKNTAIGTSFLWTDIDNRTVAAIGTASGIDDNGDKTSDAPDVGPAQVHTGSEGELKVNSHEDLWFFGFVDTGAKTESDGSAFAGSGLVMRHNHNSGAVESFIASGTQVTGGSVDVEASDSVILVNQNGSFITGENSRGVGVGVNYLENHCKVHAYVGSFDGTDDAATSIELDSGSSLDVSADSRGFVVSFALAANTPSATSEEDNPNGHVQPPNPIDDDAADGAEENAVGQGANPGKSGWSVAGDVNYVEVKPDIVWAFIDDPGTMSAARVSISAVNHNSYIGFAGALAIVNSESESSSNTGLAGSFSGMSLSRGALDDLSRGKSDTLAYIRRATLIIGDGGLDLGAHRSGTFSMMAAGGAGASRGTSGFESAGSAAWNDLQYATKAYVQQQPNIQLAGPSSIQATDRVATLAIAGDVVWNGSIGFGTSWAWNDVDRQVNAVIEDSTITQSTGDLAVDAILWNVTGDNGDLLPNAYAVAGTLGKGTSTTNLELTGTVAVNQFNSDTSADAVKASMSGTSYTSTAVLDDVDENSAGLIITATDNSNLLALAGGIDLGADFTLGVAAAVNELDNKAVANIESSTVLLDAGDVTVEANTTPEMNAFALGVAVSGAGGTVVAGSGAANRTNLTADAHVKGTLDSSNLTHFSNISADNITIDAAINYIDVAAGAGAFGEQSAITGSVALGAAVAVNDLSSDSATSYVEDAKLTANSDLLVHAKTTMKQDGVVLGLAVGLDEASSFALGGSVVKNTVNPTTDAHVTGATAALTAKGDIEILANEQDLVVAAGAGVISIATQNRGARAVGAAVPTNVVDSSAKAYVEQASVVGSSSVTIQADRKNAQTVTVALGGEDAAGFALGGSVATNNVTHKTDAHVSDGSQVSGDAGVSVLAAEESPTIVSAGGNFSISNSGVAIGAAVVTNTVNRDLRAYVGNKDEDSFEKDGSDGASIAASGGSVEVKATRTESFVLAIGVSGEGADTFALGGSAATNDVESSTVDAHAWGATLDGSEGVNILAHDTNATHAVGAGNLDLSYIFQASGSSNSSNVVNGRNVVNNAVENAINDGVGVENIDVQANAIDDINNSLSEEDPINESQNNADSLNEFQNDINLNINESIDELSIGSPPGNDDEISSGGDSNASPGGPLLDDVGGESTGISVGIALANNLSTSPSVTAFAMDTTLSSANDSIRVEAKQVALMVTIAGSGSASRGGVTVDATEATTEYNPTTTAYIDATSDALPRSSIPISAGGNVLVDADSVLHAVTVAGNIAFNASGQSVAGTAAALKHHDTTSSWIDHVDVVALGKVELSVSIGNQLALDTDDDFRGVSVTTTSEDVVTTVAAGIDLGTKSSNAAVSIAVNLVTATTKAEVRPNATLNVDNTGANSKQSVNVFAWNDTSVHSGGGAIGLSGGGTWGAGASSDGGNLTKTTIAALEAEVVNSNNGMSVQALSFERVASFVGTVEVSRGLDVAASASVYVMDLTTDAHVGVVDGSTASSIVTDGSVLVAADDVTHANLFAGSVPVSIGGSGSVGASVGVAHIHKDTKSTIYDAATVTAKGLSTTDGISAADGGFDVTFDDSDGSEDEVPPPNIVTNDTVGLGAPTISDPAYSKTRHAAPEMTSLRGVAVTATGRDVVKGQTYSGGGFASGNFDTAVLVRTGTTNTTSSIDGNVTADSQDPDDADQDVLVTASHDFHELAVAGSLAIVGQTSATPSVTWSVATFNTTASIGDGAAVRSAADTHVVAEGSEHLTVVSAGFAAGSVASLDAQVAVDALTTDVTALVGQGAQVDADGNVVVSATDNTHATHVAGGGAMTIAGGPAAVGASFTYLDVNKSTSALVAGEVVQSDGTLLPAATIDARANSGTVVNAIDGSVGKTGDFSTRPVQGLIVQANSSEDTQSYAITGAGGVTYAGVGGSMVYAHIHSDTHANIGSKAQINQAGDGTANEQQSVSVSAANDASATNVVGGLFAGLVGFGGAVDVGLIRNNTMATIEDDVALQAVKDVDVHAVARRSGDSIVVNSEDGAVGLGGSVSAWTIGKKLSTTYDTVSTSQNNSLTLRADSNPMQTPAYSDFGSYGDGQANRSDVSDALSAYNTDGTSPDAALSAAEVNASAADVMVASTPPSNVSDSMENGSTNNTTATIGASDVAGAGITAGNDIRVTSADRTDLDVFTGTFDLALAGIGASVATSHVRGGVTAHADGVLSAGNDIEIAANSNSGLQNNAYIVEAGAISVGAAVAVLEDHSVQSAFLGDGAKILAAGQVTIDASRDYDQFTAEALDVADGIVIQAGASVAEAKVLGATSAFAGNVQFSESAENSHVGDVTIAATSKASPSATAVASGGGLEAGDGNKAVATVTPAIDAHFGSGRTTAVANLSGDLSINANSSAEPFAKGLGIGVGIITVGVSKTTATASPQVSAYVADNAQVNLPGDGAAAQVGFLKVEANTAEDPTSRGTSSGGGFISGLGVDSNAFIEPVVNAFIGGGATIQANLDVEVKADDTWVGTVTASGDDFAGLAVSENFAKATIQPQVSAYISASSVTSDYGAVIVDAESGEVGSLKELSFDVANIDYDSNIITFNLPHGLESGDSLIYSPGDQAVVGGLENGEAYLVERTNDTQVKLVYQFDSADVDPETSLIYADRPHGIETGAPVIYDNGGLADIDNLAGGQTYYVSAVDTHHLRLASTQEIADNLHESPFEISAIDADTDTLQLSPVFAGDDVWPAHANSGEVYVSFTPIPDWEDGTAVYYVPFFGEKIGDLNAGQLYYARQESDHDHRFRLFHSNEDAINGDNPIKFHDNQQGLFVPQTSTWRAKSEGINSPESQFTQANVDFGADTITFTSNPPIDSGEIVGIQRDPLTGTGTLGLSEQLSYVAHVVESNGNKIVSLALTQDDLNSGNFLDLTDDASGNAVFSLTRPFSVSTGAPFTYRAPLNLRFTAADIQDGKIVVQFDEVPTLNVDLVEFGNAVQDPNDLPALTYDVLSTFQGASPIDGLKTGDQYYFSIVQSDTFELTIELFDLNGNPLSLSSSEDPDSPTPVDHVLRMKGHDAIEGLEDANTYYMITTGTPGEVKLAMTEDNAHSGKQIDLGPLPHLAGSASIDGMDFEFNANIIDVDYDADTIKLESVELISTGQPLTYHAVNGKSIIGLSGGQTYYAIDQGSGNKIHLAATAADAAAGIALTLAQTPRLFDGPTSHDFTVDEANNVFQFNEPSGLQTGDAVTYQGVYGLRFVDLRVDETYYVVLPDPNDDTRIRLAATYQQAISSDGASLTLDVYMAQNIVSGDDGGTHFFGLEGIGIAPPTSGMTGVQSLTINVFDSGATGTHNFVQASSTEDVDAISGTPTVKAQGVNGNLIGGIGTTANANVKPVVKAFIGDESGADAIVAISISAADVLVTSTANADITTKSTGYDVSLLAGGGTAYSTVNMLNTASTYVGTGTHISASGNVNILADSSEIVDASTDMVAGGAVDVATTELDVNIGRATSVTIGKGAKNHFALIEADGDVTLQSTSTTGAAATGIAHAFGLVEIAVPNVETKIGKGSYLAATEVILGDFAQFTGSNLYITVDTSHGSLDSHANARIGALWGISDVDAQLLVQDYASLIIGQHITSDIAQDRKITGHMSFGEAKSSSFARARTLTGGDFASATTALTGGVTRDGEFADASEGYAFDFTLEHPTNLEGRHQSKTYYIWFIQDDHVGHNASDTTQATDVGENNLRDTSAVDAAFQDWSVAPCMNDSDGGCPRDLLKTFEVGSR